MRSNLSKRSFRFQYYQKWPSVVINFDRNNSEMGVHDLQVFLESPSLEGGAVSVDLLKIARNVTQRQQPHNTNRKIRPIGNKLKLIVDAENCLDRLYGGYFSDWACGGQWNRMIQFLSLLTRAIERGNIELAVVFNGTIESCRMNEWVAEQANNRQKVGMVLKHINTKATPPPKIWWTPPTCLRSSLRMALRHLGVTVMCTMDDHHQEVIAYCREYGFHGLLADDAEYAAFDPPRYFSAENLKLTYKGSLETKEFMINELTKSLQLTQDQLCVMAALMGNFLLTESDLQDFHKKIGITNVIRDNKSPAEFNVKTLADFVRSLPPPSNMDALVNAMLGYIDEKRASKFRQSVQYYLNGTASGFLKYCAPAATPKDKKNNAQNNNEKDNDDLEVSGTVFASETTEQEEETLHNYKLATANLVMSSEYTLDQNGTHNSNNDSSHFNGLLNGSVPNTNQSLASTSSGSRVNLLVSSSSSNTSSVPSSPKHSAQSTHSTAVLSNLVTPNVSPDVLRTASLRHQKGLMASMILHVLSTQEVRLPCLMEDEGNREFPPIHDVYQPLRQRVYAVLFNLHHLRYVHTKKKESGEIPENSPQPDIVVKEWIYSRSNPYQCPEEVKAEPLPWAVPTLQRLWFGPALDDKRRRMRALLSCLNSDTPLILNTGYVPQHMLIMACVLRYIMSYDKPIMRRHELDAFLCQAFNVDLMNPQYLQELTLNVVTSRGVQLAALFMQGVEMALLANDACGAPLPWLMCCPWLYFDGKLFHYTLNRSAHSKNILEVCENHIERVVKVERMRKAILEGLDVKFAKMPLAPFPGMRQPPPPQGLPTMPLPSNRIPGGMRPRPISSRGGQLQVAGVVVGSWGANYGYQQNIRQQAPLVGYQGRGRGVMGPPGPSNFSQQNIPRGRGQQRKPGPPTFPINRKNNANKKRNNAGKGGSRAQGGQEPTLTVKTESGDIPADEIILNNDGSLNTGGKSEDCTKNSEHKGQGDAPNLVN
ncbi:constitutive coactivator of PPAR-gamma-like protein 1 isoform X2 [Tribolium castaneum]|uniref:constitutive coactivator of PPAR-gamma-like protein 1 isoform X2 n=1 Tax=Tribolium castaneum TaxID=7070 RepID=UPI00046BF796|nr:PREDICTED: constitutive coactivator of PPAR-gamma-like protein 1 isoform X2 [Tribolium castaneum]|eukprot:XP_008198021.1 PREDICTED: constitutive coactivator of PPAR-gamma-like protein 1 isoform X2 [Tribolium castaneum]